MKDKFSPKSLTQKKVLDSKVGSPRQEMHSLSLASSTDQHQVDSTGKSESNASKCLDLKFKVDTEHNLCNEANAVY